MCVSQLSSPTLSIWDTEHASTQLLCQTLFSESTSFLYSNRSSRPWIPSLRCLTLALSFWLHLWHMEVPGAGIKSETKLQPTSCSCTSSYGTIGASTHYAMVGTPSQVSLKYAIFFLSPPASQWSRLFQQLLSLLPYFQPFSMFNRNDRLKIETGSCHPFFPSSAWSLQCLFIVFGMYANASFQCIWSCKMLL